jgi:hypothetical protein
LSGAEAASCSKWLFDCWPNGIGRLSMFAL